MSFLNLACDVHSRQKPNKLKEQAFLAGVSAPDIVEAILVGRQPAEITLAADGTVAIASAGPHERPCCLHAGQ